MLNTLPDVAICRWYETFSFIMSLLAMSFDGTGGGGWVHPKGTNSMVVSAGSALEDLVGPVQTAWRGLGSALDRPWLALGGPFLSSNA